VMINSHFLWGPSPLSLKDFIQFWAILMARITAKNILQFLIFSILLIFLLIDHVSMPLSQCFSALCDNNMNIPYS
jgi:hypothetical protein